MAALDERRAQFADGLTLAEAMTWAMDNNLSLRAEALERAMAGSNRKLAAVSMLPGLTAQAGYRWRSNLLASSSASVATGTTSLVASTSSEREGSSYSLEASWNMLDFGLAWLRARSEGERENMTAESRRRMAHQVALDLVTVWDRALAFQRIQPELEAARQQVRVALLQTDRIAASRLRDPVDVLDYRSALLLVLKRMDSLVLQMDAARDDLARLLGIPAGTALKLDEQSRLPLATLPAGELRDWQYMALLNRPEIRQSLYVKRAADRNALRRYVEQFPSLILRFGSNHDSNPFLVNNSWQDASASMSMSLIRLASLPLQRRASAIEKQQAENQAELQAIAVLAQVAIASKEMTTTRRQSCLSNELTATSNAKLELLDLRARAAAVDELSLVRVRVDNLLLRIERDLAEADARRSMLMLAQSVGIGAMPDAAIGSHGKERVDAVAAWLQSGFADQARQQLARVAGEQGSGKSAPAGPSNAEGAEASAAQANTGVGNAQSSSEETAGTAADASPPELSAGDQMLCM
jgi:outer membrane protein TolC